VENLDKLVIIMKNGSCDSRVDCMCEGKSLDDFLTYKANMMSFWMEVAITMVMSWGEE